MIVRHRVVGWGIVTGRARGYAVGDARRSRILNVALEEFAANGYRGASLARIAERAGLSQPGLLHHFRTKAGLLIAVLELRDEQDNARFGPAESSAALAALVRLVEHNARVPGLVQLFAVVTAEATAPDHPAHTWVQSRYRWLRKLIGDALRAGVESGELRPGINAETYADQIIAMMDGLQLQWLLAPGEIDMPAVFRHYIDELIAGLRA